jgi:hypothetical protein
MESQSPDFDAPSYCSRSTLVKHRVKTQKNLSIRTFSASPNLAIPKVLSRRLDSFFVKKSTLGIHRDGQKEEIGVDDDQLNYWSQKVPFASLVDIPLSHTRHGYRGEPLSPVTFRWHSRELYGENLHPMFA